MRNISVNCMLDSKTFIFPRSDDVVIPDPGSDISATTLEVQLLPTTPLPTINNENSGGYMNWQQFELLGNQSVRNSGIDSNPPVRHLSIKLPDVVFHQMQLWLYSPHDCTANGSLWSRY